MTVIFEVLFRVDNRGHQQWGSLTSGRDKEKKIKESFVLPISKKGNLKVYPFHRFSYRNLPPLAPLAPLRSQRKRKNGCEWSLTVF